MQSKDINDAYFMHWVAKNNRLLPKLEAMRIAGDLKEGNTLYVLVLLYRDQAVIDWISGLNYKSKKELSKAAASYNQLLDLYRNGEVKINPGFLSHTFYLPLICAVLSEEESIQVEISNKATTLLSGFEDFYFTNVYMSLVYLLMKDTALAISHAKSALSAEKVWAKGLVELIVCIAENNQSSIPLAWDLALKEFILESEEDNEGMPESALFLDGLALLKLNDLINGAQFIPKQKDARAPVSYMYEADNEA